MPEVTLNQMLDAREQRAKNQQLMLETYKCPLICFTMNIAGPVKTSPLIERSFREGLRLLKISLPKESIRGRRTDISATGCEAMLAVDIDASALKKICEQIEESCALGRLFDMDVLDTDGKKLERSNMRGCIVCGAAGRGCSARRLHSLTRLQGTMHEIMREHFEKYDKEKTASLAVESLIAEARTTPKPGLVDMRNNGSHTDMSIDTFIKSANALKPYFYTCIEIGQKSAGSPAEETFPTLREAGIAAEKVMYNTTGGANTHKGAIYSMGILCAAFGRLWTPQLPVTDVKKLLSECAKIVSRSTKEDFRNMDTSTAGGRLYLEYGLTGIRGEVAAGFPSVQKFGLPKYKKALEEGLCHNDAGAVTLLNLVANVEDTNLYHRGGKEGRQYAARQAQMLLEILPCPTAKKIEAVDDAFIEKNLSPGGSADLLAITYFLHNLNT